MLVLVILTSYEGCVLFFVFKQKTAYDVRISDWSSDVCSSDLVRLRHRRFDDIPNRLASGAVEHVSHRLFGQLHHDFSAIRQICENRRGGIVPVPDIVMNQLKMPAPLTRAVGSEERRVGKECVSTCRSRWSPYH